MELVLNAGEKQTNWVSQARESPELIRGPIRLSWMHVDWRGEEVTPPFMLIAWRVMLQEEGTNPFGLASRLLIFTDALPLIFFISYTRAC